jgi:hypothetical protein
MEPAALPFYAVYRVVCDIEYRPIGTAFARAADGVLYTAAHVGSEMKTCRLLIDQGDRKPWRTGFLGAREERGVAWVRVAAEQADLVRPVAAANRGPVAGEEVFVLGYPCPAERAHWKLFATPRVCRSAIMAEIGHGDGCRIELQGAFPRGFSGAPILGVSDGALLGMLDTLGFAPILEEKGAGFHLGLAVPANLLGVPP